MKPILLPIFGFILMNLLIVLAGYFFTRKRWVWQSWGLLAGSVFSIHLIFDDDDPIIRMFVLIATTFTAMKGVTTVESYKNKPFLLSFRQWVAFTIGWVGMCAKTFETLGGVAMPDAWSKIRSGISSVFVGAAFILLAHQLLNFPIPKNILYPLITAILLLAFSLILHFGLLKISVGLWRLAGADTYDLFRAPAKANSLNEFWSQRWNLAFSEMTSIAVFRPLKQKIGSAWSLMIAFAFSGILHELAISVPVDKGIGLPLVYFIIQGLAVLLERACLTKSFLLRNRILAKIWLFLWLVVPLPLLFHHGFVVQVLWPLAGLTIN